ncbi:MAG: hypothetical protein M1834_003417 [Cirrosporium novae-zelandiae]|nr:MAG: hypothetical protein M1834_003417 [Cirrosporium novae-zelandiae]
MGQSRGLRSGTRYAFSRDFRKKGFISLSTYLRQYKVGDIVDLKTNGAVQKGSVGVIIYKRVGNRYLEKRVNVRIEHVSLSRSREDFLKRVKENAEKKRKAKAEGTHLFLKRQPVMPREAHTVSTEGNKPETITPVPYETTI